MADEPTPAEQEWFPTGLSRLIQECGGRAHQTAKQNRFQTGVFIGTPLMKHESREDFKGNNFSKTHILSQLTFLGLT